MQSWVVPYAVIGINDSFGFIASNHTTPDKVRSKWGINEITDVATSFTAVFRSDPSRYLIGNRDIGRIRVFCIIFGR